MPVKNAIKRWDWKRQKNIWSMHQNTSSEKVGDVGAEGEKRIKGTTYAARCLPTGVVITSGQKNRKSLLIQNRDAANSAFISFGSRDVDEPTYPASKELLPGETLILDQNVFTDDIYGACTLLSVQVILSVTEGLEV